MTQRTQAKPPVFFNPMQIRMPISSVTSILHRLSGVLLAPGISLSLYVLQLPLQNQAGYDQAAGLFRNWAFRGVALLLQTEH